MPRNSEGVLPTCVSGNRETDLSISVEPAEQTCPHPSCPDWGKVCRVLIWADTHEGERICRSLVSLLEGRFQHVNGEKNEFGGGGDSSKRKFSSTLFSKETLHGPDLSSDGVLHHGGKDSSKWVPGHTSCAGQLKKPVSLQQHPKHGGETSKLCREEIGKEADKNFKGN